MAIANRSGDCLQDRLNCIYRLNRSDIASTAPHSPYAQLLSRLGNPHLHLPPTIHIAGTNGKGSTLAFIRSMYEAAGYTVHAYTSPHLIQFNERIVIGGQMITDSVLLDYMDMVDTAKSDLSIGFSEYITALALKVFADHPADLCLLETGLGGRLDPTNIIPSPYTTVITPIGYDHMDYLGHTIKDIAAEKAGIIKPNIPCIIAKQHYQETISIFETQAEKHTAPLHISNIQNNLPKLGLQGEHQRINASTAMAVIDTLNSHFPVDDVTRIKGLKSCRWPARMERITRGKIYDILPQTCELWFDGGHNTEGAQAIARELKSWKESKAESSSIHIIFGTSKGKDVNGFLSACSLYHDTITYIDLPDGSPKAQKATDLERDLPQYPALTAHNITDAIKQLHPKDNDQILVCGSLYLYQQLW